MAELWENKIIFNRNNPNFEIKQSNEEISKMFKNDEDNICVPVVINNKIMGFVKHVKFWDGDFLFGDILFQRCPELAIEFFNYEVTIDENDNVVSVDQIEYRYF